MVGNTVDGENGWENIVDVENGWRTQWMARMVGNTVDGENGRGNTVGVENGSRVPFTMATGRLMLSPGRGHINSAGQTTGLTHDLPKLANETELQKMLADERMRSQMHKTHYEQLKEEHRRLQDEYSHMEEEIKRTIEESKIVQEKYKSMYEICRKELMDKNSQHEELMSKVVTPQRLEIIRMQLTDDLEKSYREKFQKQEQEIDEFRNQCNKLIMNCPSLSRNMNTNAWKAREL
ncbi:hypothetical protein ScPMuIL_008481 [Solemya velum]